MRRAGRHPSVQQATGLRVPEIDQYEHTRVDRVAYWSSINEMLRREGERGMQSEKSDKHRVVAPGTAYVLYAVPGDDPGLIRPSYKGLVTAKDWNPDPAATPLEDGFFGLL
jgi:hypothetical protein